MEPKITTRESFTVLGVLNRIDPMSADYSTIWEKQFMPYHDTIRALANDTGYFGVYFGTEEPGKVDFIAGMSVGAVDHVPEGLVMREVPTAQYAVVDCGMDAIGPTWGFIYGEWLQKSDRYTEATEKACFEYFPPGIEKGEGKVSIHVPVIEK
jgi:predicted transcriptional regulator YdeE